jgi:hypothetical protein
MRTTALALVLALAASSPALARKKHHARVTHKMKKSKARASTKSPHVEPAAPRLAEAPAASPPPARSAAPAPPAAAPVAQADDDEVPGRGPHH